MHIIGWMKELRRDAEMAMKEYSPRLLHGGEKAKSRNNDSGLPYCIKEGLKYSCCSLKR
jgi:hypothetical protein